MSVAKTKGTKAAGVTAKSLIVNCAGDLEAGELIVGTPTAVVLPPDELTITGIAVNAVLVTGLGKTDVQVGRGIRAFVGGGVAGTTYTITFSYDTDAGQMELEAVVQVKVT